jgi:hypothetical protein
MQSSNWSLKNWKTEQSSEQRMIVWASEWGANEFFCFPGAAFRLLSVSQHVLSGFGEQTSVKNPLEDYEVLMP